MAFNVAGEDEATKESRRLSPSRVLKGSMVRVESVGVSGGKRGGWDVSR